MAPAAAMQLLDLWNDACAAALDGSGRLVYRSNLLGADLRVANFGCGGASAGVDAVAPLTGETVNDAASRSTGGIIDVDAGDAVSFTR